MQVEISNFERVVLRAWQSLNLIAKFSHLSEDDRLIDNADPR